LSFRASYGVVTISKTKLPAKNSEAYDPCPRRGARVPREFVHGHYQYQLNRSNIDVGFVVVNLANFLGRHIRLKFCRPRDGNNLLGRDVTLSNCWAVDPKSRQFPNSGPRRIQITPYIRIDEIRFAAGDTGADNVAEITRTIN